MLGIFKRTRGLVQHSSSKVEVVRFEMAWFGKLTQKAVEHGLG